MPTHVASSPAGLPAEVPAHDLFTWTRATGTPPSIATSGIELGPGPSGVQLGGALMSELEHRVLIEVRGDGRAAVSILSRLDGGFGGDALDDMELRVAIEPGVGGRWNVSIFEDIDDEWESSSLPPSRASSLAPSSSSAAVNLHAEAPPSSNYVPTGERSHSTSPPMQAIAGSPPPLIGGAAGTAADAQGSSAAASSSTASATSAAEPPTRRPPPAPGAAQSQLGQSNSNQVRCHLEEGTAESENLTVRLDWDDWLANGEQTSTQRWEPPELKVQLIELRNKDQISLSIGPPGHDGTRGKFVLTLEQAPIYDVLVTRAEATK